MLKPVIPTGFASNIIDATGECACTNAKTRLKVTTNFVKAIPCNDTKNIIFTKNKQESN